MTLATLNRYQAAGIHLGLSLLIFIGLLLVITQVWYPDYLFTTSGGWGAVQLIIGIDLILGPLLTLIVFNPHKTSLRADLSIVALVQALALTAGSYTIYSSRPIAIVYHFPEFVTLYANGSVQPEKSLLKNNLQSPPALYYHDATGGYENMTEVKNFTPLFAPEFSVKRLMPQNAQKTPEGLLSISLDQIHGKSHRLLIDLTKEKVMGLDKTN